MQWSLQDIRTSTSSAKQSSTQSQVKGFFADGQSDKAEIYINGDNSELNGDLAAKVKNGNQGSLAVDINKNFTFGLKPSVLYMRPTTQIAFSGNATSKKDRYFIIQGKPNYAQGTAILLGRIIGASALDKRQETGKANWEITSVTKSEFDNSCK